MALHKNKYFYLGTSMLCAVVFLWLFIRSADWSAVSTMIKASKAEWLFFALLALSADFGIRLMRWKYILHKHNPAITLQKCFTPYFSSFALNNLLPFRLGDVARATLFNKQLGIAVHPVVSSLMIERITDLVSLLALFFGSLLLLSINVASYPVFLYILIVSSVALLVVIALLAFPDRITAYLEYYCRWFERKNWSLAEASIKFIHKIVESFNTHISLKNYAILLLAALMAWVFEALTFAMVARSLDIHLAVDGSFFVMSMATLSTLLPGTPGYVGTFDYLCKLSLTLLGSDENRAVAASLLMHMANLLPITLVGGVCFTVFFGTTWKDKIRSSFQQ